MKHFVVFFTTAPDFWEFETYESYEDALKRACFLFKELGTEILIFSYRGKVYFNLLRFCYE